MTSRDRVVALLRQSWPVAPTIPKLVSEDNPHGTEYVARLLAIPQEAEQTEAETFGPGQCETCGVNIGVHRESHKRYCAGCSTDRKREQDRARMAAKRRAGAA